MSSEGRTIKSKKHLEKSDECFFNPRYQSYIYVGNKALATDTHKQQAADSFLSCLSQLSQLTQLLTIKLLSSTAERPVSVRYGSQLLLVQKIVTESRNSYRISDDNCVYYCEEVTSEDLRV